METFLAVIFLVKGMFALDDRILPVPQPSLEVCEMNKEIVQNFLHGKQVENDPRIPKNDFYIICDTKENIKTYLKGRAI